jgi:hypothetical protein
MSYGTDIADALRSLARDCCNSRAVRVEIATGVMVAVEVVAAV